MDPKEIVETALPLMVAEVAGQVRRLDFDSELFRLRFWYYDTCAPKCYLLGDALTTKGLEKILAEEQHPGEEIWTYTETELEIGVGLDKGSPCSGVFASAYQLMDDIPMSRKLSHALCLKLNSMNWSDIAPITKEFVAYSQNGTDRGCDCYEDFVACVPNSKQELLRAKSLLGPADAWQQLPRLDQGSNSGAVDEREKEADRVETLPESDQIAFWIGQLDGFAAGRITDSAIRLQSLPLRRMEKLEGRGVVALLKFACKWAGQPEWDIDDANSARPTPMAPVILDLFKTVQKVAYADREVEVLLREFLEKSIRSNKGRTLWGLLPLHCAKSLHKLFEGYPAPDIDDKSNALIDPEKFFDVKLH